MQFKTSRIAFAIEDSGGTTRFTPPRVVVSLSIDDFLGTTDSVSELRNAVEHVAKPRRARELIAGAFALDDEQLHIVPCKDCVRLLWVDRAAGVLESVVMSPGAVAEAVRGLLGWAKQTEHIWGQAAD